MGIMQENLKTRASFGDDANERCVSTARSLAEHILAMAEDAYLTGHPEWQEIVREAAEFLALLNNGMVEE